MTRNELRSKKFGSKGIPQRFFGAQKFFERFIRLANIFPRDILRLLVGHFANGQIATGLFRDLEFLYIFLLTFLRRQQIFYSYFQNSL